MARSLATVAGPFFVTGRMNRAKGLDNANFSQSQFVTYYKRRKINLNISIDYRRGSRML